MSVMNWMSFVEAQFRFHYPIQVIHEWKCFCMYSKYQPGRKRQNEMSQSLIIAITEHSFQCCQNCDDFVISLFYICSKLSVKQSVKSIRENKTEIRNIPCTEELNLYFSLMLKTSPQINVCDRERRAFIWHFYFHRVLEFRCQISTPLSTWTDFCLQIVNLTDPQSWKSVIKCVEAVLKQNMNYSLFSPLIICCTGPSSSRNKTF